MNVAVGASDDGSSWAAAYRRLEEALRAAQYGDEIWVAAGTYPAATVNDLSTRFVVPAGVRLYGGFAGSETALEQRDSDAYASTLTGELLGFEGWSMRAIRMFKAIGVTETTRIDDFTIVDAVPPGWA